MKIAKTADTKKYCENRISPDMWNFLNAFVENEDTEVKDNIDSYMGKMIDTIVKSIMTMAIIDNLRSGTLITSASCSNLFYDLEIATITYIKTINNLFERVCRWRFQEYEHGITDDYGTYGDLYDMWDREQEERNE